MVSANPPVWWPIGSEPNLCAYIWLRSAGLEARRHQREIAAGKDPPGLRVVESDGDADGVRPAAVRIDQGLLDLRARRCR